MSVPRYELGRKVKERDIYSGRFEKFGRNIYTSTDTILLTNVTDGDGKVVADHVWINRTKGSKDLGWLSEGDVIQFEARVVTYRKKNKQNMLDYKLSHPTKFMLIGRVGKTRETEDGINLSSTNIGTAAPVVSYR